MRDRWAHDNENTFMKTRDERDEGMGDREEIKGGKQGKANAEAMSVLSPKRIRRL